MPRGCDASASAAGARLEGSRGTVVWSRRFPGLGPETPSQGRPPTRRPARCLRERRAMSRVLIVDNPPLFRTLEASFIHRAGWEILSGRVSEEIVARASTSAPDLILLDTSTPGFDTPA